MNSPTPLRRRGIEKVDPQAFLLLFPPASLSYHPLATLKVTTAYMDDSFCPMEEGCREGAAQTLELAMELRGEEMLELSVLGAWSAMWSIGF